MSVIRTALILILCIFEYINTIFLIVEGKEERCITREMQKDESFGGFYVISGEDEKSVRVFIANSENKNLWELEGQRSGSFQMGIVVNGNYALCIENKSDKQVIFSFEFNEEKKEEQILSIRNN